MDSLRKLCVEEAPPTEACSRCGCGEGRWDRLANLPFCPHCEEALIQGEIEGIRSRPEDEGCTICGKSGTLRYVTYPLNGNDALEMHLCAEHFRNMLGRRLPPHAYHQLRRLLATLQLDTREVFLLHEAFYNDSGKALRPVQGE